MESYTPLLEKTRAPQPSLQKFAVVSVFSKLRSAPSYLGPDSDPGREAIAFCLHSTSPAVADQSVRELCRLVADSKMEHPRGLMELQSSLEGSDPKLAGLFVKGIGFLVRLGFQRSGGSWSLNAESHPFVKVLLCRAEVRDELVQQVLLFMFQNKQEDMSKVCEFLRPFLSFSVLRMPFSDFSAASFVRHLLTSMASICCSLPHESIPIFKLLMGCIKYHPLENMDDLGNLMHVVEHVVNAYAVVLKHSVGMQSRTVETQLCGVELLETVLLLNTSPLENSGWIGPIIEFSNRILVLQKDLGLGYLPEVSSVTLSLFVILIQSELEHEQMSMLKLLLHLLKWKCDTEHLVGNATPVLCEELLLLFPAINLMSWPSTCIKAAAGELIVMLEKIIGKLMVTSRSDVALVEEFPSVSSPGKIVYRLLQHLWFQDRFQSSRFFIDTFSSVEPTEYGVKGPWAPKLREYAWWIVHRRKSSLPITKAQDMFVTEMSFLVCSIAGLLVVHPSLGTSAMDVLASMGIMNPKVGVPLLLATLFFSNISACKSDASGDLTLNVLRMLPSLASHSSMVPLIIQTILPLLQRGANTVLYAMAARLLCQTWEINDRAFGSLQGVLLPNRFAEFMCERNICLSMAASIRDVCRKNPDRGVDLILSISACIESRDPLVQALGFQSLAHLCEADVLDFYTAWDVIAKHVLNYSEDPILAHSMCLLLRWGAMDAEAYPETSRNVTQILWGIGASMHPQGMSKWLKARVSAFDALNHYEISYLEKTISDFKERITILHFSETDDAVLCSMERFQMKIIAHEHMNRRRFTKEKRVATNKIEKLLDVFPQVLLSSAYFTGKGTHAMELPGAAILCLSFSPKLVKSKQASPDVDAGYENALVDIATSLQLSRNSFLALVSLQSWKSFMQRWIRAKTLSSGSKGSTSVSDNASKAANDILKRITRIAEDSIPRTSENIALAIGALCVVVPPSAHTVKSAASEFLLNWLSQFEHEHRQWSAAISLGLIASCLHVTDHKKKFQNSTRLIEVLCGSKSTLVKGACGIGLGFICQDLLTRVKGDASDIDEEDFKMQEIELLGKIIRSLSIIICQSTESSSEILHSLSEYLPKGIYARDANVDLELVNDHDVMEKDVWGLAGLVFGLGNSIGAAYRGGELDVVLKIKELIFSWVPHVNPSVQSLGSCSEKLEILLSVGASLALPLVVAFCHRVELMENRELDRLFHGYRELLSVLVSVKKLGFFHESFLVASCASAGTLLGCILNEGVHSIEVEVVMGLLELFRKCYSIDNPPIVHFGGMLGVVSSLGADLGILFHTHPLTSSVHTSMQKESSHIMGPLHSSPVCEVPLTSMLQEIFLVAQNSEDRQLQHYAAWALSLLRHSLWSKEVLNSQGYNLHENSSSRAASQTFSNDSVVMKLSLWLINLDHTAAAPQGGPCANLKTLRSVMKCLSEAPRLPNLDWGAVVRRYMRYEAEAGDGLPSLAPESGTLREECLLFSIAQASHFDQLLTLLDELSDLSRFRTLEARLQSCLLLHLADLVKMFSGSRIEKLLRDVVDFFSPLTKHEDPITNHQQLLRISCLKGLHQCLQETSMDFFQYGSGIKSCVEVLVSLLPAYVSEVITEADRVHLEEEWSEAVRCLEKAPLGWLLKFLQVDSVLGEGQIREFLKKFKLKVRLVKAGSIQMAELGRLKALILNMQSDVIWNVLTEVVAALQHAEGSVKRQWLVDAVEISCVSSYPSTAILFVGLLSGSFSKYMPLLILDRVSVLSDLPVTLASLLAVPAWESIAERLTSTLWASTERLHCWLTGTREEVPGDQEIDPSECGLALSLLHVMHGTCVCLKKYLPLEKQIRLADIAITSSP
ncbi:protein RST1 isoform X2 [Punica granatum]|uniref:Protein RST1 isoform X2 n=1 Tax=Punica granatum TaxID=22663 RepID=A0A6P8CPY7_PUNGR|nr:protein RST1 isoform X2 [Punica granatum]